MFQMNGIHIVTFPMHIVWSLELQARSLCMCSKSIYWSLGGTCALSCVTQAVLISIFFMFVVTTITFCSQQKDSLFNTENAAGPLISNLV